MTEKVPDARTERERRLGRSQAYIHAGYNPYWSGRPSMYNGAPATFRRPKGLPPVKGGRWHVRKLAKRTPDGHQWSAYSQGSTKGLSARFPTQQLAVKYAQSIARLAASINK